ncbi:MAG: tRNA preQ1(34) S-adenosylmethionine ribosyltransferase-isomerase QueA [Spirochaetes bacterium]|jgi:S-adenosylmethionine:tRNA ribosyltransferase-isomerase|nr:tRNA preQ1(34) S-adenosylmethionine ribosyltransferase-isomerase QueA [Spirochaetota bacterium]
MPQDRIFTLNDFNFDLPEELIAQYPAAGRTESRLFVLDRKSGRHEHAIFRDIGQYLRADDVLVLNNVKVIPARMYFKRTSGGLIEIVLTHRISGKKWLAICNRTKRLKKNETLVSAARDYLRIKITGRVDDCIEIESDIDLDDDVLRETGEIPLPPYITRKAGEIDRERYQTVYAEDGTAAASPTAGLHFSEALMESLSKKGIMFTSVTLNVSWGTFQPVRDNDLSKHKMHKERFSFSKESAGIINTARKNGQRIIAVGTTSLRVLESTIDNNLNIPGDGETDLFIYPPEKIKSIDALITNFHTPYSTLLMLVSSFAGYDVIMNAYREAVGKKYRFFSYGDAMLIL